MKTNLMKKAVAVTLSVAMACSASMMTNPTTASAAKKVGVKTTFKTLKIGTKHTLKVVNKTGWKITKTNSSDKSIANAYFISNSKGYVKVKAKSEGRATIKVTFKNTKTKAKATAKCRYKVIPKTTVDPGPGSETPDVETETTVDTQEKLDAALKNKDLKKITIKTDSEASFTIAAGDHKTVKLVVDAPKSDVTNNGNFESIEIKAVKNGTYTENAKGNTVNVTATVACKIVIGENGEVAGITISSANSGISLVADGKVGKVTISAKVVINISGKTKVPVVLTATAAESKLTASTTVDIQTSAANTDIVLENGAAGSTIKVEADNTPITVKNNSGKDVVVTKKDGTPQTVANGTSANVAATTNTTNPGGTTTPSNPSTNVPKTDTTNVVTPTGLAIVDNSVKVVTITTGSAKTVTTGSISFGFDGVEATSGAAVEYMAEYTDAYGNTKTMNWSTATQNKDGKTYSGTVTLNVPEADTVTVTLKFRIKATATTNAGTPSEAITVVVNVDKTNWTATATKN